jgi:predicted nucleic acid-binding protein
MELYLETGVLAAYYAPEAVSAEAEGLVRATAQPAISDLVEVELFAALNRKVRRAELAMADARRIRAAFLAHLDSALYARVPLGREHFLLARDWAGRESTAVSAREAIHLAAAALSGRVLATLDPVLAAAAGELGVQALPIAGDDAQASSVHEPPAPYPDDEDGED